MDRLKLCLSCSRLARLSRARLHNRKRTFRLRSRKPKRTSRTQPRRRRRQRCRNSPTHVHHNNTRRSSRLAARQNAPTYSFAIQTTPPQEAQKMMTFQRQNSAMALRRRRSPTSPCQLRLLQVPRLLLALTRCRRCRQRGLKRPTLLHRCSRRPQNRSCGQ